MGVKVRERPTGSGIWWLFIDHQGRRKAKKVGDQEAAEEAASKIQARLTLGKGAFPMQKPKAPTLKAYYGTIQKSYLKTATRKRTQQSYEGNFRLHILPQLGTKAIDRITKADVRNLIAGLMDKNLAKPTIRIIVAELCAVLNHGVEDRHLVRNPAAKCSKYFKAAPTRHSEIQPLNPEEVGLFLTTVLDSKHSRKHHPLFLAAIHTGMRSGELAGLQWGDIDFSGKFLTVRRSYGDGRLQPTKTDKVRRVDLSDALLSALAGLKRQRRQEWLKKGSNTIPEFVFSNQAGQPPDMHNIKQRHFLKNLERAGLRRIRFHDVRHTFASLLIQNGESLAYVRDQLGHSSITLTVNTYAHLVPGANRQAVNKLPTEKDVSEEALAKTGSRIGRPINAP